MILSKQSALINQHVNITHVRYAATWEVFVDPLPALVLGIGATRRDDDQSVAHIFESLYAFTRSRNRSRLINKWRLIELLDFLERFLDSAPERILSPRRQYHARCNRPRACTHLPIVIICKKEVGIVNVKRAEREQEASYNKSGQPSYWCHTLRYALIITSTPYNRL